MTHTALAKHFYIWYEGNRKLVQVLLLFYTQLNTCTFKLRYLQGLHRYLQEKDPKHYCLVVVTRALKLQDTFFTLSSEHQLNKFTWFTNWFSFHRLLCRLRRLVRNTIHLQLLVVNTKYLHTNISNGQYNLPSGPIRFLPPSAKVIRGISLEFVWNASSVLLQMQ